MIGRCFVVVALVVASGCEREGPVEPPAYLYDSRFAVEPDLERLKNAGDDPSKALRPASAGDLQRLLEPGKRHLYVLLPNGAFAVAPKGVEAPGNFWTHPILAGGGAVKAAGTIRIERSGDKLAKVILDAESDAYCPTTESLRAALAALVAMGVGNELLRVEGYLADCGRPQRANVKAPPAAPAARPSFGTVMISVAHRFELLGRAQKAKRHEVALYALEEIEETFRNEIPGTALPPLPAGVSITPFVQAMTDATIPEVRKALEAKDDKAFATAFDALAKTCNGCHVAAGRAFLEVPSTPGESAPRLEPRP
jgi:hypothetical protein